MIAMSWAAERAAERVERNHDRQRDGKMGGRTVKCPLLNIGLPMTERSGVKIEHPSQRCGDQLGKWQIPYRLCSQYLGHSCGMLKSTYRLRNCGRALGVSRREALGPRSTTRLPLLRLVSVAICIGAVAVFQLPHLAVSMWTSTEAECLCQEDGERSKQKQVRLSSARYRLDNRLHSHLSRPHETGGRLHQVASYAGRVPAIVGHQLANGLGAPLLI